MTHLTLAAVLIALCPCAHALSYSQPLMRTVPLLARVAPVYAPLNAFSVIPRIGASAIAIPSAVLLTQVPQSSLTGLQQTAATIQTAPHGGAGLKETLDQLFLKPGAGGDETVDPTRANNPGDQRMAPIDPKIEVAVLAIANLTEQELAAQQGQTGITPLSNKELAALTKQLKYLADPKTAIPSELLGYLEGLTTAIEELLTKDPGGRNVKPTVLAARALHAKVTAMPAI